jgi:hypothetical protein
MDWGLFRS